MKKILIICASLIMVAQATKIYRVERDLADTKIMLELTQERAKLKEATMKDFNILTLKASNNEPEQKLEEIMNRIEKHNKRMDNMQATVDSIQTVVDNRNK